MTCLKSHSCEPGSLFSATLLVTLCLTEARIRLSQWWDGTSLPNIFRGQCVYAKTENSGLDGPGESESSQHLPIGGGLQ